MGNKHHFVLFSSVLVPRITITMINNLGNAYCKS